MDIDGDTVPVEVEPAKANTRKTRPIHRGSSTAATSSTQDRSMDFRSPDVAGASRKGRRKRDEDDDFVSDYMGIEELPTINTTLQPPKSYTLPRNHPYATDFLPDAEREHPDAWKQVWRDNQLFEELGPFDVEVLVQHVGVNQFFDNSRDGSFSRSIGRRWDSTRNRRRRRVEQQVERRRRRRRR